MDNMDKATHICTRCSQPVVDVDMYDYSGDPHCEICYDIIHEMIDMCRYDDIENPSLDVDPHDDSSQPDDND